MGKTCFKCGVEKELEDFYKHPRMSDGRVNKCKECNKTDVKENRNKRKEYYSAYDRQRGTLSHRKAAASSRQKKNKELHNRSCKAWVERNKKKRKAQQAVGHAVRDGTLTKLPCFICGNTEVEGHHPDYDSPLDVVWLCTKHHGEIHRTYDHDQDKLILQTTEKGSRWRENDNSCD